MIITIDGPAGAGKSTAARDLARRLGFRFLDTGAMYRAATLACLRAGVDLHNAAAVAAIACHSRIELHHDEVWLDGENVSAEIRTQRVTQETRFVASNPVVRAHLVALQREAARGVDVVTEGRDQGTVVFPDAEYKFFLTADPQQRALRRLRELEARGETTSLDQVETQQRARDERDALRDVGPLKPAADARVIDTSDVDRAGMVDLLERLVTSRCRPSTPSDRAVESSSNS